MQIRKAERRVAFDRARAVNPRLFDRVMKNTRVTNPDECWLWLLATDRDGYGAIKVAGKQIKAHRATYSLFRPGDASPLVRHLCNNPACVNPLHLRGGTPQDNAADRVAAKRGGDLRGARNGRAKLSDEQVLEIRGCAGTGAEVAKRLGVSKVLVCRIRRGAAWTHI